MEYFIGREKSKYCYMQKICINIEQKTSHKRVNAMLFHVGDFKNPAKLSVIASGVEWGCSDLSGSVHFLKAAWLSTHKVALECHGLLCFVLFLKEAHFQNKDSTLRDWFVLPMYTSQMGKQNVNSFISITEHSVFVHNTCVNMMNTFTLWNRASMESNIIQIQSQWPLTNKCPFT